MDKPNVLVVDDNEATCTLVAALLRRDFQVETSSDGQEAIERLRNREYAAVLLDLRMPVVDGYGVLDHLAATAPASLSKVIVLTASLSHPEMNRVANYPVHSVVAKPFDVESLLETVKKCARPESPRHSKPILSGGMIFLLADLIQKRLL
jgi:CheY-like chemotaxis protein